MSAKPLVILLVEDDADIRAVHTFILEQVGVEVVQAVDGTSALAAAEAHQPDLVLLDLFLPDFDGWEVSRRLSASPTTAHLSVIALSANPAFADDRRTREAAFAAFWTKPLEPRELAERLRRVAAG